MTTGQYSISVPLGQVSVSEDHASVKITAAGQVIIAEIVDGDEIRRLEMDFSELFTIFDHWMDGHTKVETIQAIP